MTDIAAQSRASAPRGLARRLLTRPSFLIGSIVVLFWVVCALFWPVLVPYDPFYTDLMVPLKPPSATHWFGTDQLGRDVFSRVLAGARDILTVAPLATLLSTVVGTTLGLIMGYAGGLVDEVLSRIVDAVLALPVVIVALLALTSIGASMWTLLLVIGFSFSPIIARTVRASVLAERQLDYVAAARLRRENHLYTMFVEILPNVLGPVMVEMTIRLGYAIFTVATLSFIGFGIQPPSPDWGLSISTNYGLIGGGYWWTVLFDGLAIATLVVGVNLVADSIQGALND
ncbi:ABC transporter permease [Chachezhania sediminis]|uniref:ABC transporter permease n=1 Tax=Chachezhania sediminis TaxID=2599291 RepID=UPI00131E4E90|nr:ABC transporter permease [Chachezhania sediminis]